MRAGGQSNSHFGQGRGALARGAEAGSLPSTFRFPPSVDGRSQLFAFAGKISHPLAEWGGLGDPGLGSPHDFGAALGAERHQQPADGDGVVAGRDQVEPRQSAIGFRRRSVSLSAQPRVSGLRQLLVHHQSPHTLPASSVGNMNLNLGSITLRAGAIAQ